MTDKIDKFMSGLAEDTALRHDAVALIFDQALKDGDIDRLRKIRETYPRALLECALGGDPEYIDEISEEGEN